MRTVRLTRTVAADAKVTEDAMSDVTRRDLLRGATAAAVIVGWDPVSRSWATAGRRARSLDRIPKLDGVLLTDPASRRLAADDYGHLVHRKPVAVLRPGSVDDIVKIVHFARKRRIRISVRGQAHSGYGQAQARSGIVIDSSTLARIHHIGSDEAVVDPGVVLRTLILTAAGRGVTPPVVPDYQGLSVGGILSLGGFDSGPMPHGAMIDNVHELRVVTGDGDLLTCSPTRRRRLFRAVLGGLGQCGIIVRASLRMVHAPAMALMVRLGYEDLLANHADLALLVRSRRLDAFEQFVTWDGGRWVANFQGAAYFDPPSVPNAARLLEGLHDVASRRVVTQIPYTAWTLRLDPLVPVTAANRKVLFNALVPEKSASAFLVEDILSRPPAEIGGLTGLFLQVPGSTANTRMPLLRTPKSEVFIATNLFRSHTTDAEAASFLTDNRRLYDRAVKLGATRYPWDAVPDFSRRDWARHFGDAWPLLQQAKRRYDPAGILGPGPGIFSRN
jgi:cytokinin dehydrogenase